MKILVIEDEVKIAKALKKGLTQEGYAVDLAHDGETGLDFATYENYDVILLDLMLPIMDGIEVCKQLREEEVKTPVLMLTAKSELEDKVKGLNTGADDYLTKPFEFEELLARIKALMRRPKDTLDNNLTCGDLELNSIDKTVARNNENIELSRKEFSLLEYLMRNQDKILTKEQIMRNVWDFDSNILPNTVEVYIGYLRNKIDKKYKKKLIRTVRGFGYKLSCA